MDKRYQVFVSSTFADLQDERQEVMQALLELDCMPAGMELFPAANEDQWSLIKKVIDDCDYYVVIIAGRYGSLGSDGLSYTEMEYRYALAKNKPVIGFVHKEPGTLQANRTEQSEEGKTKLAAFRELVKKKMCRMWDSPADLGSQVSRSLVKLIKSSPAIGWVKADQVASQEATTEILQLKSEIDELRRQLNDVRTVAPEGSSKLQQGDDDFEIAYNFVASPDGYSFNGKNYQSKISFSWDAIFAAVAPNMIHELSDERFKDGLDRLIHVPAYENVSKQKDLKEKHLTNFSVTPESFHTIKVQLRALGLIVMSDKQRSVKDTRTFWTLTPYGDTVMTRLLAITRDNI